MKTPLVIAAIIGSSIGLAAPLFGESIQSDPLGFNSVTCPVDSDTIVVAPFRPNGSQAGSLASAPVDNLDNTATLTLSGNPGFDPVGQSAPHPNDNNGEFAGTHYVKLSSQAADADGRVYPIDSNTADTLTVFLNGAAVPPAVQGDTLVIAAYWTLDTLFPPADADTDAATTGHAVVASASPGARATEILLPDHEHVGINLYPNQTFYIYNGAWRKFGQPFNLDFGSTQMSPDTYFIIRHNDIVTSATTFKCSGEVELGSIAIPLRIQAAEEQDHYMGIPRPVNVALNDLGLISSGAFEASPTPGNRIDELYLFDNVLEIQNKSAATTYYYYNNAWRKFGQPFNIDFGTDPIKAGEGFMIRKGAGTPGTVFWNNPATYDNQP